VPFIRAATLSANIGGILRTSLFGPTATVTDFFVVKSLSVTVPAVASIDEISPE
jgi:hypothetical protein